MCRGVERIKSGDSRQLFAHIRQEQVLLGIVQEARKRSIFERCSKGDYGRDLFDKSEM